MESPPSFAQIIMFASDKNALVVLPIGMLLNREEGYYHWKIDRNLSEHRSRNINAFYCNLPDMIRCTVSQAMDGNFIIIPFTFVPFL